MRQGKGGAIRWFLYLSKQAEALGAMKPFLKEAVSMCREAAVILRQY